MNSLIQLFVMYYEYNGIPLNTFLTISVTQICALLYIYSFQSIDEKDWKKIKDIHRMDIN